MMGKTDCPGLPQRDPRTTESQAFFAVRTRLGLAGLMVVKQ